MKSDSSHKTDCHCDRPLFIDERVLNMGVNCIKCGRSAEGRLDPTERAALRRHRPRREHR